MITLINGEATEKMKKMIELGIKVDCVITDPPYNIAQDNNFQTMGRTGIDFGEWDKNADILTYIEYLDSVTNKDASVIIFNAWRNLGDIAEKLEANGFVVKDLVRWKKTNPMPRNRDRRYIVDYEFFIFAVKKGARWTFNRQSETYDRSEIVCGLTPKNEKIHGFHTTQKPVQLMQEIVKRHTNKGDLVLDMFSGTGTTGVACKMLGREYIGIELDEQNCETAKNRIKEVEQ